MNAQKTECRDCAIQEQSQLALDEPGDRPISFPLPGQEGLQIFSDDAIEDTFFSVAGTIDGRRITNDRAAFGLFRYRGKKIHVHHRSRPLALCKPQEI